MRLYPNAIKQIVCNSWDQNAPINGDLIDVIFTFGYISSLLFFFIVGSPLFIILSVLPLTSFLVGWIGVIEIAYSFYSGKYFNPIWMEILKTLKDTDLLMHYLKYFYAALIGNYDF